MPEHPFRVLYRFDRPVDRRTYFVAGLALAVIKSLGDYGLARLANVHPWAPWVYLRIGPELLNSTPAPPRWLLIALGAWALPFLWLGATLTIRRLVDAGRSPWWCALWLIPVANYALILALVFLPAAERRRPAATALSQPTMATGIAAVGVGIGVGLAMVLLSITALGAYGTPLFIGTPLAMGMSTGFWYNRRAEASLFDTLDGYLQPVHGEFRLIPLPGGRTRLEGSTWYTLWVFPDGYWSIFGDALIHRIHLRVLAHIRNGAEPQASFAYERAVHPDLGRMAGDRDPARHW